MRRSNSRWGCMMSLPVWSHVPSGGDVWCHFLSGPMFLAGGDVWCHFLSGPMFLAGGDVWCHFLSGPMFLAGGCMMSLPVWSHVPCGGGGSMMSLSFRGFLVQMGIVGGLSFDPCSELETRFAAFYYPRPKILRTLALFATYFFTTTKLSKRYSKEVQIENKQNVMWSLSLFWSSLGFNTKKKPWIHQQLLIKRESGCSESKRKLLLEFRDVAGRNSDYY